MSAIDRKSVVDLLFNWQYSTSPTNFTSRLFELYAKADPSNKQRLRVGFPLECEVYDEWYNFPDGDEYFRQKGYNV